MALVPGFTHKAVFDWASADLAPGCIVTSDGLGCFAGVTDAGCQHRAIVADGRKPKELPEFNWINTVLGNLKTSLGALIMHSISPNTEPVTSVRLFTVFQPALPSCSAPSTSVRRCSHYRASPGTLAPAS